MLADTVQRLNQHGDQIAIGKKQDQQAGEHRRHQRDFGQHGQAIDVNTGLIELNRRRLVKGFGAGAKGAAQRGRYRTGVLTIDLKRPLARLLQLRHHALVEQLLPAGDGLVYDLRLHRAGRHLLKLRQLLGHIVQRLLYRLPVGVSWLRAAGFHLHHARQARNDAEILVVALA